MEDHCASSSWSDLPWDLLDRILQLLELPEALAVASVCAPWQSAAVASGDPRSRTPWLVLIPPKKTDQSKSPGSEFRNLLDIHKTYTVSLPQGRRHLGWFGASRGWLVGWDELSNLFLCNPFTFAVIPLPPVTAIGCVKGAYDDDDGSIVGYHYGYPHHPPCEPDFGSWFYLKVVLSCDPSHGDDYIAMVINGNNQVSFARAGESAWRVGTTTPVRMGKDVYADCVYQNGRFYAVTMGGAVEAWDPGEGPAHEPSKQVVIAGDRMHMSIHTRFLVSTPWGDLLQIRNRRRRPRRIDGYRRRINVEVLQVDVEESKLVTLSAATAFREHAVFVGLNESACLHAKEFPELKPNCVYFTTPWLKNSETYGWSGVVVYDLENQTSEDVLDRSQHYESCPEELWFIPNI